MSTLWRNWSSGQRISVVVVFATLVSLFLWSYTAGSAETWEVLFETRLGRNSDELRELLARLDTEEIPWRLNQKTDGRKFDVQVRPGDDYKKALLLAAENGLVDEEGDSEDQGLFGGGLTDTPERARLRLEQVKSRKVEKAIRCHPGISFVDLVIKHGKSGRFATDQDTPDTAVVLLRMIDSTTRLVTREAETIRKLVSSAFAIEVERIQIVDSNMRDYPGGADDLAEVMAQDLRVEVQKDISEVIEGLYLGVFAKEQFRLGVIIDDIAVDSPKAGASVPVTEAEAPGEAAGESRPGTANLKLKYRATVSLVLDIGAVKEVLARRDQLLEIEKPASASGFAGRLKAFEREQEEFLARQLPLDNARVTVKTEAFFRTETKEAGAPSFIAGLFEKDWELGSLSDASIYAGGGFVMTLLAYCLFTIRARRKRGLELELAASNRTDACRETLDAVEKAGRLARNTPEVSSAVVKMWLSEGREPAAEMSNPAGTAARN